jgi:hypothetical protein
VLLRREGADPPLNRDETERSLSSVMLLATEEETERSLSGSVRVVAQEDESSAKDRSIRLFCPLFLVGFWSSMVVATARCGSGKREIAINEGLCLQLRNQPPTIKKVA